MTFDGWGVRPGEDGHGTAREPRPETPWTLPYVRGCRLPRTLQARFLGRCTCRSRPTSSSAITASWRPRADRRVRTAHSSISAEAPRRAVTSSTIPPRPRRWLHGETKWNGRSNFHIDAQDDCTLHFHSKSDAEAVGALLGALYDLAREMMPGADW